MVVLADLVRTVHVVVVLIEFRGCAGRVSVIAISKSLAKSLFAALT